MEQGQTGWPAAVLVDGIPDIENITDALKTGPYGRCAYECDNDVGDNQVRPLSRHLRSAHGSLMSDRCGLSLAGREP